MATQSALYHVAFQGSKGRTPYDPCQSRYKWLITPAARHAAIQRHGGGAAPRRAASQRSSNPATAVNPTISTAAPANECVIPRWYRRYPGPDRGVQNGGVTIGSVQSGAFPAIAPSSPAQGMRRSLTARPSAAPTSVWARGSMRPYKVPRPGACNESGAGRVSSRHALLGGRMRRLDLIPVLALGGLRPPRIYPCRGGVRGAGGAATRSYACSSAQAGTAWSGGA